MDKRRKRARFQRRLLDRAQRRLNRLMDLMAAFETQNSDQEPGDMEDVLQNNLTRLFTRGLALSSPGLMSTTISTGIVDQVTPSNEPVTIPDEQICRGKYFSRYYFYFCCSCYYCNCPLRNGN